MSKKFCREESMSAAAIIDEARTIANDLILRESRGPGDMPRAMERLERQYGIPASTFFTLRYRNPKRIWADVYLQLRAAHDDFRARQLRQLQHDIDITRAKAGHRTNSIRAAEAVANEAD